MTAKTHRAGRARSTAQSDDDLQLRDAMDRLTAYVTAERAKVARSGRVRAESETSEPGEQP